MRLEVLDGRSADRGPERWAGAVLCRDVNGADGRPLLLKGRHLTVHDEPLLRSAADVELHLLWLEDDDVGEDIAAVSIAEAVAGACVLPRPPVESQVRLVAAKRGLLHVDVATLRALNGVEGVTVFTLPTGTPVDEGRTVAGVKITPLAISSDALGRALHVTSEAPPGEPILRVHPFAPLRIAAVVRQQLTATARAKFETALTVRAEWFGGSVGVIRQVVDDPQVVGDALAEAAASADIVLAVGVASVDPLDITWQSLLATGAEPVRRGLPMHPGSSYWLATLRERPVIGVASCGMFSRRSALDILLTRLHAGLPLDPAFLAGLGHGGLLAGEAAWRIPNYGGGLEVEPDPD